MIPGLNAIRGYAVLAVLVYHFAPNAAPGGYLGVTLFFVLSGYLITNLLVREHDRSGTVNVVAFYNRRVRRLLPAAMTVILFALATGAATHGDAFAATLWHYNVHAGGAGVPAYGETTTGGLAHFWSLAIEEQFYLVWPLAALLLFRLRSHRKGSAAAAVAALLAASAAYAAFAGAGAYLNTFARVSEILAGVLIALTLGERRLPRAVALGGLAAFAAVVLIADSPTGNTHPTAAIAVASLAGVAMITGAAARTENPVLVWFGSRSYSLYLWHWPLLVLFPDRLPFVAAATVVAAEVSYRTVEQLRYTRTRATGPAALATAGAAALIFALTAPLPQATAADYFKELPSQLPAPTDPSDAGSSTTQPGDTATTEPAERIVTMPEHEVFRGADGGTAGTVIHLHGGGWVNSQYGLANQGAYAHSALQFIEAGYTVIAPEFNLDDDPTQRYQDILDVVTAVKRDPDLPDPIIVAGYSSGGHLASWVGANWNAPGRPADGARPDAIVNMSGPLDPIVWHPSTWDLRPPSDPTFVDVTVVVGPLGRVADQSDDDDPPQLLIYSKNDDITPYADQLAEAALIHNATLVEATGGHAVEDITDLAVRVEAMLAAAR